MNKLTWLIVITLINGFLFMIYFQVKAEREEENLAEQQSFEIIKTSVNDMITRTGANAHWHKELVGSEPIRLAPVLTIELEKHWVNTRPILFIGRIKDIVSFDRADYEILIDLGPLTHSGMALSSNLRLSVTASKNKIDSLLSSTPDIMNKLSFFNNVAVVAEIESIQTRIEVTSDGTSKEIKNGTGKLIDIVYVGSYVKF